MKQPKVIAALAEDESQDQNRLPGLRDFMHSTVIHNMLLLQQGPDDFHHAPAGAMKRATMLLSVPKPVAACQSATDIAAAALLSTPLKPSVHQSASRGLPTSSVALSSTAASSARALSAKTPRHASASNDYSCDDSTSDSEGKVHRITAKRTMKNGSVQYKGQP
jgi:hypothetical protein